MGRRNTGLKCTRRGLKTKSRVWLCKKKGPVDSTLFVTQLRALERQIIDRASGTQTFETSYGILRLERILGAGTEAKGEPASSDRLPVIASRLNPEMVLFAKLAE